MANNRNDELRSKIVKTACAMFLERGYAKTTLKDIAAACDISPSLLQYYFGKRSDFAVAIFYDLIERCHSFLAAEVLTDVRDMDEEDVSFVGLECFYRIFYEILQSDDDRLLRLYTVVLYDAALLKRGTDLIWGNRESFIVPRSTPNHRVAISALNGMLSQLVAVYLENRFEGELEGYVDLALGCYYDIVGLKPARRAAIHEAALSAISLPSVRSFVREQLDRLELQSAR